MLTLNLREREESFASFTSLLEGALSLASAIARYSPVAVQGTKYYLNRASDGRGIQEELDNMVGRIIT